MSTINTDTITKLLEIYQEDKTVLTMIFNSLKAFETYHSVIYEMETWMKVYSYKSVDKEEYQATVTGMDKRRTVCHNSVLTAVNVLNRIASKEGLSPVYDGIVSEERPYRREVANAVLTYVEDVIKNRR